jgi:hypothetical protein
MEYPICLWNDMFLSNLTKRDRFNLPLAYTFPLGRGKLDDVRDDLAQRGPPQQADKVPADG